MGGVAKTVGRIGSGVFTLGGSELARKTLGENNLVSQALQTPGAVLTGGMNVPGIFMKGQDNPYVSGPFALDPAQMTADKAAITGLGESQYQETMNQIPTEIANAMNKSLPGIAEDYNAGHLLNSSGYGNEVARQHSQIAKDLVGQAISGRQGFQTGALQRGLSLEDFINQANVSKSIGQAFAPQQPTGKQNFGTVAQGIGAIGNPIATAISGVGKAANQQQQKKA